MPSQAPPASIRVNSIQVKSSQVALPASIRAAAAIAAAAIAAADTPPAPPSVPPRGRKLAAWLRSKSGAAPTLMETEAVTVDEGRG